MVQLIDIKHRAWTLLLFSSSPFLSGPSGCTEGQLGKGAVGTGGIVRGLLLEPKTIHAPLPGHPPTGDDLVILSHLFMSLPYTGRHWVMFPQPRQMLLTTMFPSYFIFFLKGNNFLWCVWSWKHVTMLGGYGTLEFNIVISVIIFVNSNSLESVFFQQMKSIVMF